MKGHKTGGRQKGTKNKSTVARESLLSQGLSPLAYMLRVMRDEKADPERRDEMAKAAAPYCHAKLQSIEHAGEGGQPIQHRVTVEFVEPKPK